MSNNTAVQIGFDKQNFKPSFLIGAIVGLAFVFIIAFAPTLTFGIPNVPQSVFGGKLGQTLIVGFAAPIIEELFFRVVLTLLLTYFVTRYLGLTGIANWLLVSFIIAVLFSLTHFFVYTQGGLVSSINPFVGAGLFSLIASALTRFRSLMSAMIVHSFVNLFLVSKLVVFA